MKSVISENLARVELKITEACRRAGRARSEVKLLAVSKMQPALLIRDAFQTGLKVFGENYVQEALLKQEGLRDLKIDWHFIGHLQSNKAKDVVGRFSLIHSLDKFSTAQVLSKRASQQSLVQNVLLEINVAGEVSKSGVKLSDADELLSQCQSLEGIKVLGAMTMPPLHLAEADIRKYFALTHAWVQRHRLKECSMGTSEDFEWAILEGATIVRLGSVLLGARPPVN